MEVILKKRIEKLGLMGDVVKVKAGFARNYLLRRGFADMATAAKIAEFENKRVHFEADNLHHKQEAEAIAIKMQGLTVHLVRQAGDTGLLYGSVRSKDIVEAAAEQGFTINRDQVSIVNPIKTLGVHTIDIMLHPEISVPITIAVAMTAEEAAVLADKNTQTVN